LLSEFTGTNEIGLQPESPSNHYQGIFMKKNAELKGSVLVVGGGIAGMQAALDMANSGFYVYLVEKSPAIGGVMAQLDKTFPTNDCSM
jgi:heterodisulfide reductase subunit A